jgi:transposase
MMGCLKSDQGQLFYEFHLNDAVPEDHLVRKIDAALDLSWLRGELAPHYSSMGRPPIDPELMIRMLVVGYVIAIRSERLICREVQVNLAYRGSANSASRTLSPIIRRSRVPATSASGREMFSVAYSNGSSKRASRPVWSVAKVLQSMLA